MRPPALVVTLCALLYGLAAVGQPRPATDAAMSDEARARYEAAARSYAQGRFDEAAGEFQRAYALSGRAELLFNIGRAFEDGGHSDQALEAYEHFQRDGAPGVEASVLAEHLTAVRARLAQRTAPAATVATTRAIACPAHVVTPAPPNRTLPLALMIGGGLSLASAGALGISVISSNASLANACPGGACPTPHDGDVASARSRAIATDVMGAVGLGAIAAGAIVWVLQGSAPAARTPAVSFVCGPSSCGAAASVAF